jgi:exopolysaccharide biosynthesis polyprenyl glycosylphosphotransferase
MLSNNKYIHSVYLIIDIALISFCFYIPYRLNLSIVPQDLVGRQLYLTAFSLWLVCLILILNNLRLYRTSRNLSITSEIFAIGKGVGYSSILSALFIFILKIDIFSRVVFIESTLALFLVLSFWRFIKRIFVRRLVASGHSNFNVLIVGIDSQTEFLIQEIINNPFLGLKIIGILDDKKTGDFAGFKILGGFERLEYAIKKHFVDEVFISGLVCGNSVQDVISRCIKLGKTVRLFVDNFGAVPQKLSINYLGVLPLVTYFEEASAGVYTIVKRVLDFLVSMVLLILLSPLFILVAILIKLESNGPIFHISRRSGKKGRVFYCYKFRSMVHNAESMKHGLRPKSEVDGPIFKIKQDPRITRLGRFLRKYSLDELPQLFNVFIGDMSLVGPRPFPVEESDKIEYYHSPRLNIRPGITGLAQVKGRSDLRFNKWMRWDIWYANNLSIGLDIKIVLWTIPAVVKAKGAY